jgi:tetratricopeptide (TPR) repeat protein
MLRPLLCAVLAGGIALWESHGTHALPTDPGEVGLRLPLKAMRSASLGYQVLLSDWYWIQAIQYYGTPTNADALYPKLSGYLGAATDLDPEFDFVYQFGGETLPMEDPNTKLWHHTQAAIELLQKGMASHSSRWQIPFLLAYVTFTFRGNYSAAGAYLREAANRPHSPAYLSGFAAKLLAQGGEVETAIEFTEAALQRTTDDRTQRDLKERLDSLHLQQDLELLNLAARARRQAGKPVRDLSDLVGYGQLQELPIEPFGGEFKIVGEQVMSTHQDKLLHLFTHPGSTTVPTYVD